MSDCTDCRGTGSVTHHDGAGGSYEGDCLTCGGSGYVQPVALTALIAAARAVVEAGSSGDALDRCADLAEALDRYDESGRDA